MTKPIPRWVMISYSKLWNKYRSSPFTFKDVKNVLQEDKGTTGVVLHKMQKSGWINSECNSKDRRRKIYQLESPENAIRRMQ